MANIIAVVWDFDKTLVDGYMQDPIFQEYKVEAKEFWKEVNSLPEKYMQEQGVLVNPDTIYLNQFIKYAKDGKFKGLTNQKLLEFGKKLKFYNGIPDIFEKTKKNGATYFRLPRLTHKNGSGNSNLCFTFKARIYEKIRADLPAFSRSKHFCREYKRYIQGVQEDRKRRVCPYSQDCHAYANSLLRRR